MTQSHHISEIIKRMARLDASMGWANDLHPTQYAALHFLSRANRFSRSPSHVADYLGATRGTISQTLKALSHKGYITERRSETDKRVISYDLTKTGEEVLRTVPPLASVIDTLGADEQAELQTALMRILQAMIDHENGKHFGLCCECIHHKIGHAGRECLLLKIGLTEIESHQICFEQECA